MIHTAITVLIFIGFLAFTAKRLLTYLHILQQDDYDGGRLLKWMIRYGVFDKKLTLLLLSIALVATQIPHTMLGFFLFLAFVVIAYFEKDPRKQSKKKLVLTARTKRIYIPALLILVIIGLSLTYIGNPFLWIFAVQAIPFVLIIVNYMLSPFEIMIQQKYWNEAQAKLRDISPTVVAITGSYGKTSVKHILGHILKTQGGTLATPGSTNTAMGTARIIREELDDSHKYLVVEMGAYGPGSVNKLCALTPPDIGIITAIGHAHYERFKTLDTVARAKFELAESVVGRGGMMVVHEKTLGYSYPRQLANSKAEHFMICFDIPEDGVKRKPAKDHLQVTKIRQTDDGLKVSLTHEGKTHVLEAPLYGTHHGMNMALAFGAARQLGVTSAAIKTALKSVKQIQHRLEVKRQIDGTTIIDDAFNSNPRGFRAALDLLAVYNGGFNSMGRKILITPGMVEMGGTHDDVHDKIGRYAGQVCDIAIVVNPDRIRSFVNGFKATGDGKILIEVPRFTDAAAWVAANKREGDVILLENDLPDLYERVPRM